MKKSLIIVVSLFSVQFMAFAQESTGGRTSADYSAEESSLDLGETTTQGNKVKKNKIEVGANAGVYVNDPDNRSASAGLSIGGKIRKKQAFITKIGDLSLSPKFGNADQIKQALRSFGGGAEDNAAIDRAFAKVDEYALKGGILFAPGVEGNLNINVKEGAIDQAKLDASLGSAYHLEQRLPFGNWDASFGEAGAELSYDRYMDVTKAVPLSIKLADGSFHGSWTLSNTKNGKKSALVQLDPYAQIGLLDFGIGYSRSRSNEGFGTFSPMDLKLGLATRFPQVEELGAIITELNVTPVEVLQGPDSHKVEFKIGVDGIGGNTKVGKFGLNYDVSRDWTNVNNALKVDSTTHAVKIVNDDHDVTRHMLNLTYTPDFDSIK